MPWSAGRLLLSGRDALRLLLAEGVRRRGWRRLWVPEYLCQQVVAALARPGLELRAYPDHPLRPSPDLPDTHPGDAVLVLDYFGLREPGAVPGRDGVEVVEDHSHDPVSSWARASTADFCVASLRKTMPLSDGGALWSPRGHVLPPQPGLSARGRRTAATKFAAMILKAMYLAGHPVEKDAYLALAVGAERGFDAGGVSGMSDVARAVLASFPIDRWRSARKANHAVLRQRLAGIGWAHVLPPAAGAGVPFSCVVVLDLALRRERVRLRLIEGRVYPAVLWPLEETVLPVGAEARDLSRRVLSIPCDGRYGSEDMCRVGDLFARAGER